MFVYGLCMGIKMIWHRNKHTYDLIHRHVCFFFLSLSLFFSFLHLRSTRNMDIYIYIYIYKIHTYNIQRIPVSIWLPLIFCSLLQGAGGVPSRWSTADHWTAQVPALGQVCNFCIFCSWSALTDKSKKRHWGQVKRVCSLGPGWSKSPCWCQSLFLQHIVVETWWSPLGIALKPDFGFTMNFFQWGAATSESNLEMWSMGQWVNSIHVLGGEPSCWFHLLTS